LPTRTDLRRKGSSQDAGHDTAARRPGAADDERGRPKAEPTLLYVLKQIELSIRTQLDEVLRPLGMTTAQYTAMTVLERHPDLTSAQLARRSFVSQQTMAEMVATLESRDLVDRHRDGRDRRRLVLALTDQGSRLLDQARYDVAAIEQRMLAGVTEADVVRTRRLVNRFRTNLADHKVR
jgi:DNA-binding MarR family transcriptional regulator